MASQGSSNSVGGYHYFHMLYINVSTNTVAYIVAYAVAYILYVYNWQLAVMNTVPQGRWLWLQLHYETIPLHYAFNTVTLSARYFHLAVGPTNLNVLCPHCLLSIQSALYAATIATNPLVSEQEREKYAAFQRWQEKHYPTPPTDSDVEEQNGTSQSTPTP